jgi:putative DNA primase/helicase
MIAQELKNAIVPVNHAPKVDDFETFKDKIRDSFIRGSGIDPELFDSCVEFHRECEWTSGMDASFPIHEALGWHKARFTKQIGKELFGAFLKNEDGTIWQVIVNIPGKGNRGYSYFTPKKSGDKPFLPPVPSSLREKIAKNWNTDIPSDGSFWEAIKDNKTIPLFIVEGGKKGLSGLSSGIVAIALYGCSCGGKNALIPGLEQFAGDNSILVLALDQDTKESAVLAVQRAKKRWKWIMRNIDSYFLEINWKPYEGKGLDDLIVNSPKAYKAALKDVGKRLAKMVADGTFHELKKVPKADILAKQIAEDYRNILAFNNNSLRWMRYGADFPGVWSLETSEFISSVVMQIIESKGYSGYGGDGYINNVVKMLRHHLIQRNWIERSPKELLPFKNGVLEVATGKLLPHSPGYRLTWQLPREHNPLATNWDAISNFLDHLSSGNSQIKELLLCYCNAVIKGRSDLQKFLHLIGLGGTGKGTFARLVVSLIGEVNTHTTTLEDWCGNNFEGANAYQKRLVLFPDEDKATGKLGKFLSLTGEDSIRAENKGQKAFSYRYDGMVLVCSNLPVFAGDSASRVKRRVITVPCNNPVATNKRQSLEEIFAPELAAFTNYVLALPDDHVTRVLRGLAEIPECTLEFWLNRMRVDSLADWLNDKLIYDPTALTPVGCDRNEGSDGSEIRTLFGSYSKHCRDTGNQAKSTKTFSPDLIELCNSVLGWNVKHKATNTGKFISGIRLRVIGPDDLIPTHEVLLEQKIKSDGSDGSGDGSGDGSESLLYKESDGSDGSTINLMKNKNQKNQLELLTQSPNHPITEKTVHNSANELVDHPSLPSQILSDEGFQPSPDPSLDPSLVPSTKNTPIYKKCDRVIFYPSLRHAEDKKEFKATITDIEYVKGSSGQEFFNGCVLEYFEKGVKKQVTFAGGDFHWLLRKV